MTKPKRAALLLVSDKTGIVELAAGLQALGYELVSAGSTAKTLKQAELIIEEVSTANLDPNLLLRITGDLEEPLVKRRLEDLELLPIDLVVVNLYPLAEVLSGPHMTQREAMEFLDVVPSAVLRAAARSFERVTAVCDTHDYEKVLDALGEFGELGRQERQAFAAKAFYYTAYYDSTVAQYLSERPAFLPDELVMGLKKQRDLHYGENPHQRAALYSLSGSRSWGLAACKQVQGKDLHFNHYVDLESGLEFVGEFTEPACGIFKHGQPCGAAAAERPAEALRQAFRSDPLASTGGIAALNREVDEETARLLSELAIECFVAPEFTQAAMDILRLKKDLRLITVASTLIAPGELTLYPVSGGLLVEDKDNSTLGELRSVTERPVLPSEQLALTFAWKLAKHAKTYAAILAKGTQTLGIGSGQPSRMDALKVAVAKSNERHPILKPEKPLVLASDGPLPLRCLHEAAAIGVAAIVQPGGTSEDHASIQLCNQHHMAMAFTGIRHFKH